MEQKKIFNVVVDAVIVKVKPSTAGKSQMSRRRSGTRTGDMEILAGWEGGSEVCKMHLL